MPHTLCATLETGGSPHTPPHRLSSLGAKFLGPDHAEAQLEPGVLSESKLEQRAAEPTEGDTSTVDLVDLVDFPASPYTGRAADLFRVG